MITTICINTMNITQFIFRWLPDFLYFRELNLTKQQWFFYKWVKRHLGWAYMPMECVEITPPYAEVVENQSIFMYWKQGRENAPEIVKRCLASVKANADGHPLVLLDASNLSQYVRLPAFIERKHAEGIIPEANYSDMLRTCLLLQYGGYWIDATCYLSCPFPEAIRVSEYFMFQRHLFADWASPLKCSNWFIHARKGSPVLLGIRNWLFNYWKRKSYLINYYMFHYVTSVLAEEDRQCRAIWQNMPYVCSMDPHVLQYSFARDYSPRYFQFIMDSCFIHKLTYKYDKTLLESKEENILKHFLVNEIP